MGRDANRRLSEVDLFLSKLGLEKYRDALASHGMHTMEDLRLGKGTIALVLPLGPKARLLKALESSEADAPGGSDEFELLVRILRPYSEALAQLSQKLAEAARHNPGGPAGRQYVIASTTLRLCEKAIRESQRYQVLGKRSSNHVQADRASCKSAVGSCVRQLRIQQAQGIMRTLEEADPSCLFPYLDLSQISLGQLPRGAGLNSTTTSHHSGLGHSSTAAGTATFWKRHHSPTLDVQLVKRLRTFRYPPENVQAAVFLALKMFGYDETTWSGAKEIMGSAYFLTQVQNFAEASVPEAVVDEMKEFVHDADLSIDEMRAASSEAGEVAGWIHKVYHSLANDAGPPVDPIISPNRDPTPPANQAAAGRTTSARQHSGISNSSGNGVHEKRPLSANGKAAAGQARARPQQEEGNARSGSAGCANAAPQGGAAGVNFDDGDRAEGTRQPSAKRRLEQREADVAAREAVVAQRERDVAQREAAAPRRSSLKPRDAPPPRGESRPGVDSAVAGVLGEMASLKQAVSAASQRELLAQLGGLYRAAATAQALVAHVIEKAKAGPRAPDDESDDEAPSTIPIGSTVTVTRWVTGEVTGTGRGRIGVVDAAGKEYGVLPGNTRAVMAKVDDDPLDDEDVDLNLLFPIGCEVSVGGKRGSVTGHARGRVGIELRDGGHVGALPNDVLEVTSEELAEEEFPVGCACVLIERGTVTGEARGRVGVRMPDGSTRGVVPDQLKLVDGEFTQFATGTPVVVVSTGRPAVVTGCARGRVGVTVDGKPVGLVPTDVVRADSQHGLLRQFPVGAAVNVMTRRGTVTGHARGRVGVEMDGETGPNGEPVTLGVVVQSLRFVEFTPEELKERFDVGRPVRVGKQVGLVTEVARGRIGVEMTDGTVVGVLPNFVTTASEAEYNKAKWPAGLEVVVVDKATVVNTSRGRLGVKMADGTQLGVVPEQVQPLETPLNDLYPEGTRVVLLPSNQPAVVTSCARGRVGVRLPTGEVQGVVPAEVSREDSRKGMLKGFPIGSSVAVFTRMGEIAGHARGRVNVDLDDGSTVCCLPADVKPKDLTAEEIAEKHPVGTRVEVAGRIGEVVACSRGRVGVKFPGGEQKGVLPQHLRIISEQEDIDAHFPVGTRVETLLETGGTLVGKSRGRLGVLLEDGSNVGCLPSQVTIREAPLEDRFPIDAAVEVKLPAKVTGISRGRVGITLANGVNLGVIPDALSRQTFSQDFPVNTWVRYEGRLAKVVGHSRGRVGIEFEDGETMGVVPPTLHKASKVSVARATLRNTSAHRKDQTIQTLMRDTQQVSDALLADVYALLSAADEA
ncbi:hypothetical protein DIPPA_13512 [Diplonema papillatum]|nr:hypothetical protein DIPPA_13512 [Diplonema papillatum]